MRFMAIIKATADYEAGRPPNPELIAAMGKLSEENQKAGIFEMGGGLLPSAQGHRLKMTGGKITVTDGPFAETKEVIGGFAILNYASHEDAIAGARRVMEIHAEHGVTELELEIRPMFDPANCGQMPDVSAAA
ncbi:MAG: YciI family protein [Xanthobacteraceae bacterium]